MQRNSPIEIATAFTFEPYQKRLIVLHIVTHLGLEADLVAETLEIRERIYNDFELKRRKWPIQRTSGIEFSDTQGACGRLFSGRKSRRHCGSKQKQPLLKDLVTCDCFTAQMWQLAGASSDHDFVITPINEGWLARYLHFTIGLIGLARLRMDCHPIPMSSIQLRQKKLLTWLGHFDQRVLVPATGTAEIEVQVNFINLGLNFRELEICLALLACNHGRLRVEQGIVA